MPMQDLGIGGKLRRLAGTIGKGDVANNPGAIQRGEQRGRAIVAGIVSDEETLDPERPVVGDPFEDVRPLVPKIAPIASVGRSVPTSLPTASIGAWLFIAGQATGGT